jgi:CheY-like chemotaxis protein
MLRLGLEIEDYSVSEEADRLYALALIDNIPLPDVMLLDMLMLRMNGWEFVEKNLGESFETCC